MVNSGTFGTGMRVANQIQQASFLEKKMLLLSPLIVLSLWISPVFAATSEAKEELANAKLEAAEIRVKAKLEMAEERAKNLVEDAQKQAKAERERSEMLVKAKDEISDAQIELRQQEASTHRVSSGSSRAFHPIGAYAALWGDPYPAKIGVNVGYNVEDFVRLTVGVGSNNSFDKFHIDTVGVGAKFLVPGWSLSPSVAINLSNTSGNPSAPKSVLGFDPTGTRAYASVGLDWQTNLGLYFAAGYSHSVRPGEGGSFYTNAGIFL